RLHRPRRPPRALGPPDRVRQRRGRRLPRRPPRAPRGGGRPRRGGRRARLPGHDRRRHVRLGAADPRGCGLDDGRPGQRPAPGAQRAHHRRAAQGRAGRAAPPPHRRGAVAGRPRERERVRGLGRMSVARARIAAARRVVVKVGSSSLTSLDGGLDPARLQALVDALAARREAGSQVVLVSSGAIAAGLAPLGLTRRPRDLATQQAAAAVGQLLLAEAYAAAFGKHDLPIGQVLLTADDMIRRSHYRNAQRTLERLLKLGVLPVVNENDTVATDEIRVGDNDRLAALVAHLIGADGLVLLSDVDGLYDGDPRKPGSRLLAEVEAPSDLEAVQVARARADSLGTGGMATKITAAAMAAAAGLPVPPAAAEDVVAALDVADTGPKVGTAFRPSGRRMSARRFWLRHAADVRGALDLD